MLENIVESLKQLLFTLPVIIIALTFHEYAHGYVSYKLGDPTPRSLGRLTLNPLKHLDPIGFICMIVAHVGWAKPVPVNPRYYKKPRQGMALTAFAGPVANLLLGFIGVIIYYTIVYLTPATVDGFWLKLVTVAITFFSYFITINVGLAVFNLIPIPPLDGSRIAFIFLPDRIYFGIMRYERYIMIAMLILLWTGILTIPVSWLANLIIQGMSWPVTKLYSLIF